MAEKKKKADPAYRIVSMRAENVRRIRAVSVDPDGNVVNITGENGQGKTSLLDSIVMALKGDKDVVETPIREGEQQARIKLDLGEIVITRTFTNKDSGGYSNKVEVEVNGFKAKEKDVLGILAGELTFDPLAFATMKPKDQFELLKGFVPGFDFLANAQKRATVFNERTDINRSIRDLKGQIAGIDVPEDTPDEEISVADLTAEVEKANEHNQSIADRVSRREAVKAEADRHRAAARQIQLDIKYVEDEIKRLQDKRASLGVQRDEEISMAEEKEKRLAEAEALPERIDLQPIRDRIAGAEEKNRVIRKKLEAKDLAARLADFEAKSKAKTDEIDALDEAKQKAISESSMPVEGLSFGEDMVMLNGHPFADASKAEQILASVKLAVASNPRLRIAFIRDASLLDKKSWAILNDIATELDVQIWVETVERETPGAIVIEDGTVSRIIES